MGLTFEWDKRKAASNRRKHSVTFEEATTVFGDPLSLTVTDPLSSRGEHRFVIIGLSHKSRLVVVVHTERGDNIRIFSARRATRREKTTYEEG